MESGGSSNRYTQYKYSRRPKSGVAIQEPPNAAATNIPADASNPNPPQQGLKREPDQYVPISNVTKIMRRILPPHARIADDAKETIQECVSEFISFITTEANDKCHQEYRRTVTAEDVLSAMAALGFDNYVDTLTLFLNKHRAQDPDRATPPYVRRSTPSFVHRPVARMARPPALPAPVTTTDYIPLTPTYAADDGNYTELPPPVVDYFMASQGGGEGCSSSKMDEFDPFE